MPSCPIWCLKASSSSFNNFPWTSSFALFINLVVIHRCSIWCSFDGHFWGPYERYGIAWFHPSTWRYHFEYHLYHIRSFHDVISVQWHRMMHCMFEKLGLKQIFSLSFYSFFRSSIYPWGSQVCIFVYPFLENFSIRWITKWKIL
jgi:hypothetical protein